MTGIAGSFYVLFTANDAYMRDYALVIPSDCVVSNLQKENEEALAFDAEVFEGRDPRGDEVALRQPNSRSDA